MPVIHLETTSDLPENASVPDILAGLVETLCSLETIKPADVKAYHVLRSNWCMGTGAAPGFARCEVMILEGRPETLKIKIADAMYATLLHHFEESKSANEVNLTLEVREMAASTYRK